MITRALKQDGCDGMKKVIALTGLAMLAACGTSDKPAPVFLYGGNSTGGSAGMVSVIPGDTPESLAANYHVAPADLLTANNLPPFTQLKPGQRLRLPAPWTYRAQNGDTPESVAHLFNVEPSQVAQLNHLPAQAAFKPGQTVQLQSSTMTSSYVPARRPVPVSTVDREALPPPSATYTPPQPTPYNAAGTPQTVLPDERDIAMSSTVSEVAQDIAREPALPAAAVTLPPAHPKHDETTPAETKPWRDGDGRFAWPINGTIASAYGNKPGGLHNDGINIAATRGTPVHAAAGGEVVYAGDDLKGFGNLILLRHPDKWVTAYAHLDHLRVARGDNVTRGQVIGTVGSTGAVTSPQLHFEIRHGTQALNPVVFLGGDKS